MEQAGGRFTREEFVFEGIVLVSLASSANVPAHNDRTGRSQQHSLDFDEGDRSEMSSMWGWKHQASEVLRQMWGSVNKC